MRFRVGEVPLRWHLSKALSDEKKGFGEVGEEGSRQRAQQGNRGRGGRAGLHPQEPSQWEGASGAGAWSETAPGALCCALVQECPSPLCRSTAPCPRQLLATPAPCTHPPQPGTEPCSGLAGQAHTACPGEGHGGPLSACCARPQLIGAEPGSNHRSAALGDGDSARWRRAGWQVSWAEAEARILRVSEERARGGESAPAGGAVWRSETDGARVRRQETDRVGARETQTETERGKRVPPPPDSWVSVWREERLGPGGQVLPEPCACMVGGGGMHTDTWAGGRRPWAWPGHQQVPTEHLLFSRR